MTRQFSRRGFLKTGAALAGGGLAAGPLGRGAPAEAAGPGGAAGFLKGPDYTIAAGAGGKVGANDRIRFGIVGVGMEGSGLLSSAIQLPGVECVAAADLYDGRHELAKEIAGSRVRTTRRYQELLEAKDIDAIIVAVPDHWHKQVVVDAVAAGKDVYCEKPMSHNAADGLAMVEAAKKTRQIVQAGAQRTSSAVVAKAHEWLKQGAIGELNLVEASLGRNDPTGAWEYPPPPDLSPANFDWDTWQGTVPKKAFDPLTFARWRCWKEYGTGVAGDLLVHLISGMQASLGWNEIPTRVSSFGGIYRWKDGRNMPDVQPVLFEYEKVPVYMRLSLGCETPEVTRFMGSHGVIELRGSSVSLTPQTGEDAGPSYYTSSYPARLRDPYMKSWHQQHDPRPGKEPVAETITFNGDDYDDLKPHLWTFFEAVRSRKPVLQDVVFGHRAALGCHMANESYFHGGPVKWDAAAGEIRPLA